VGYEIPSRRRQARFSWWQDIAAMLKIFVMVAIVVTLGVEAISFDLLGDCTVCLWERVK